MAFQVGDDPDAHHHIGFIRPLQGSWRGLFRVA
jgi:hypothetical protein